MKNPNAHLFGFCPRCGEKTLGTGSEKSFICRSCDFKFYLNTAAAGIALIFNKEKDLLVTVRKNDPAKGTLDLPGGFAEPGETIEQAIAREVQEELNLEIIDLQYLASCPNTYSYREVTYTVTDMAFVCTVDDFSPIKACDDIADFLFLPLEKIDISRFGLDSPKTILKRLIDK